ncbi:hypothetical protein Poly30_16480 [Planctomycetes bacterium Poly30]|uniref:Uncharacterized protein n=1 Tax=Saltatorellus ferox TaxID=2528018 RepID=A0A518EPX6_9BACT|nr:hypothetical protein Poly30_16480 [Planctomycetes bacterium Poly30]
MEPTAFESHGGLEHQLAALYQERETLEQVLGVSDAQQLVDMVQSMSAQLESLYAEREAQSKEDVQVSLSSQLVPLASGLSAALGKVEVSLEGKTGPLTWRMRCRAI